MRVTLVIEEIQHFVSVLACGVVNGCLPVEVLVVELAALFHEILKDFLLSVATDVKHDCLLIGVTEGGVGTFFD